MTTDDHAPESGPERRRFERRESERQRSLLADQLITAEQEERRRLALELHDGPVQHLAGIALMLDAVTNFLEDGRRDEALAVLARAVTRHRETIRSLRDLSFNLEPVVLRDQGLGPAVHALVDQVGPVHKVEIEVRLEGVDELAQQAQVTLYQIVREALNQAVARGPTRVLVSIGQAPDGSVEGLVEDDGAGERRRGGVQLLEERARTLDGEVTSAAREGGGTTVRIALPVHAARR